MHRDSTGIPRWARPWSGLSVQLTGSDAAADRQTEPTQRWRPAVRSAARKLASVVHGSTWSAMDWRHRFAAKRLSDQR